MFRFQSINQSLIKIKREVHYTIWALFLAIIGVEMGYIIGVRMIRTPVTIEQFPQVRQVIEKTTTREQVTPEVGQNIPTTTLKTSQNDPKTYVASKTGTKYHLPTCVGARSIKEENKIYFATQIEAKQAGYTPAGNCKGL